MNLEKIKKQDYQKFLEKNIIECDISSRGGILKINVSSLFPNIENLVMGVYQNYIGNEIKKMTVGANVFKPAKLTKKQRKVFYELEEAIKKFFCNLKGDDGDEYMIKKINYYVKNQKLPIKKKVVVPKKNNATRRAQMSRFSAFNRMKFTHTSIPNEEFYSSQELADALRVNIMTIYRYIKAKKLKAYKIGKEFRIDKVEFQNFLKKTSTE